MNRKQFKAKLSEINQQYWDTKLELEKLGVSVDVLTQLNVIRRNLVETLEKEFSDDLMKLNKGEKIIVAMNNKTC